MMGTALVNRLKTIQDGRDKTRPGIKVDEIYEYDRGDEDKLEQYCASASFVFNLAGVNRPKDISEFREGNFGFASTLLDTLRSHNNKAPVMLSSSLQATLAGRFGTSEYGLSKKAGVDLFFKYGEQTGSPVFVYRFPNMMGLPDLTTILLYPPLHGRWQTTSRTQSMIRVRLSNWSGSEISLRACWICWKARYVGASIRKPERFLME